MPRSGAPQDRVGITSSDQAKREIGAVVSDELECARLAMNVLRRAYDAAHEKQFGIACEYTL